MHKYPRCRPLRRYPRSPGSPRAAVPAQRQWHQYLRFHLSRRPEPPQAPERPNLKIAKGPCRRPSSFFKRELEERSRTLAPNHPDMIRLAEQIRAAEAAVQAQKAQLFAMQAQQRAQIEQARADEQNRASAPGGSFLAALVAAGYGNLSVDEIIEFRNSGVSPEFLRAMRTAA